MGSDSHRDRAVTYGARLGTTYPDRTITLSATSGLLHRIASAMIARHGVYTYTDDRTGDRVLVLPDGSGPVSPFVARARAGTLPGKVLG